MANLASINIKFLADLAQFSSQMQNAERTMKSVGKQFTKIGSQLSVGLTAPIIAFGAASVIAFDKQAKAVAQVEAGLKSTGNTAGKTLEQLKGLASGLQNNSLFGDEQILQDVTAQLLTFTNIAGTQFDRTQQAALDLATRLDGDLKSASIQLGKALNDPVKGLSALAKSGIQFSEDQKAVINSMATSGRLAEAQTLILDELEKQYGGAAAAAAAAGTGPFKQLSNSIGDLSEEFGEIITKALIPIIDYLKDLVSGFQNMDAGTKKTIVVVAALAAAIGPVLVTIGLLATTVIPGLISAFTALSVRFAAMTVLMAANPFGAIAIAVGLVVAAFLVFRKSTDDVVQAQSTLVAINNEATKSIAAERAKLNELLIVARDEKVSKEQRVKAIKQLNEIAPKYLGNLTLETINTDAARVAVDKYNESLIRTAKVKAAQAKLVEIERKLIDAELSAAKSRSNIQNGLLAAQDEYNSRQKDGISVTQQVQQRLVSYDKVVAASSANLISQRDALVSIIRTNEDFIPKNDTATASIKEQTKAVKEANEELNKLPNITGLETIFSQVAAPLAATALSANASAVILTDSMYDMIETTQLFNAAIGPIMEQAAESFLIGFGALIGNAAAGGNFLKGFAQLFLGTLADMAINVGKTAIGIGLAVKGIKVALESLNPVVAIAAGIALVALGTFAKSAMGNIAGGGATPFAKGGIVYGPTNALVGEYAGARTNPEVIAPLNKLKKLIEPASSGFTNVTVGGEFILRGDTLVQVIQRTESRNNRTR